MKKFLKQFYKAVFLNPQKREIMIVNYFPITDTVECLDWVSVKIKPFSGPYTSELWEEIKKYCTLESSERRSALTQIYIWAGMERKYLAYSEHVKNYLDKPYLLRTGQGYHYGSTKNKHIIKTCSECGHTTTIFNGALDGPYKIQ